MISLRQIHEPQSFNNTDSKLISRQYPNHGDRSASGIKRLKATIRGALKFVIVEFGFQVTDKNIPGIVILF